MTLDRRSSKGTLYLCLIVAGVGWGLLDWAVGGVLAPLRLPSRSVFLIPLAMLILAAGRGRTRLTGSCAFMGVGAALGKMALGAAGRCPGGFFCQPVAMMLEALLLEGMLALVRIRTHDSWARWSTAGGVAGALSSAVFAVIAVSIPWIRGGWGALPAFLALRIPFCLVGGALTAPVGARLGALRRAAEPEPATPQP